MITNTNILRVFLYTSPVIHLIDLNEPRPPTQDRVRCTTFCGYTPMWPGYWLYADGIEWRDNLEIASMPPCSLCERVRRAREDDSPAA